MRAFRATQLEAMCVLGCWTKNVDTISADYLEWGELLEPVFLSRRGPPIARARLRLHQMALAQRPPISMSLFMTRLAVTLGVLAIATMMSTFNPTSSVANIGSRSRRLSA